MDTRPRLPTPKTLAKFTPGLLYSTAIDPALFALEVDGGDEFLRTFALLHKAQGRLLAAHWCQAEVKNGGFHQFFLNSSGVLAPEAILGFLSIEMKAAAVLVKKAVLMFGPRYPRDQELREPMLDRLTAAVKSKSKRNWSPFDALDDAFYALPEIDRFDEYADAFVRRNLDVFFR